MEITSLEIESFKCQLRNWAMDEFGNEISNGFRRSRTFDAFQTRRLLGVLLSRDRLELEVLAHVLPLQVFNLTSDDLRRKSLLPAKEGELVSRLRADYERDHAENFMQGIAIISRINNLETKRQFKLACGHGNQKMQELVSRLGCTLAAHTSVSAPAPPSPGHGNESTSRPGPPATRRAAQFLFCKIFEHQTEGGFWFSMLR